MKTVMSNDYKMTMILIIRNIVLSDFGSYRCVAQNSLGKTDGLIRLYGNNTSKFYLTNRYKNIHSHGDEIWLLLPINWKIDFCQMKFPHLKISRPIDCCFIDLLVHFIQFFSLRWSWLFQVLRTGSVQDRKRKRRQLSWVLYGIRLRRRRGSIEISRELCISTVVSK